MKSLILITYFLLFVKITFCQDLELGLQGYYQFNQNLYDASPNNIEGQASNLTPAVGIENSPETCFDFNGFNSFIDLTDSDRIITTQISLSVWVKTTDIKRQFIISNYNSDQNRGYFFAIDNGFALIGGRDSGGGFWQCASITKVDDGEWHHLVGIIDDDFWQVWVDCEIENTLTTPAPTTPLISFDPLTIGKWHQGNGNGEFRFFNGLIDEVRIYSRPLLASEIQLLCDVNAVSVEYEFSDVQDLKIIPNPINEVFDVVFKNRMEEKINYKIYNQLGRLLQSDELNSSISLADFPDGSYWLYLSIKDQIIAVEKIIKQ